MEYYKCNRRGMFIFLIDITKVKVLYYRQKDHIYKFKRYKYNCTCIFIDRHFLLINNR